MSFPATVTPSPASSLPQGAIPAPTTSEIIFDLSLEPLPLDVVVQLIKTDRDNYRAPFQAQDLDRFRNYVAGQHTHVFTDEMKEILRGILGENEDGGYFADNVVGQIVGEAGFRLLFQEWRCPLDQTVHEWLRTLYLLNGMDSFQKDVHAAMLTDGNTVVAANWHNYKQRVQFYLEEWWNGTEGIFIAYDKSKEPVYAVKEWRPDPDNAPRTVRRLVWWANRIERYISEDAGQNWKAFSLPDDPTWPVPWLDTDGLPLGLPYVHFPNFGRGNLWAYGLSELDGGILGFQDQLNGIQWDMSGSGRMTGFQMVTATGVDLSKSNADDETEAIGSRSEVEVGVARILWSSNDNAKFGVIGAADPLPLLKLHQYKLQSMAQRSMTPYHRISGGEWPSGEALLRAEGPAVGKAEKQIGKLGDCYRSLAHKATKINNVFGPTQLQTDIMLAPIEAIFESPERRDPLSKSVIVANMGTKYSIRKALRVMGHSEKEAQEIYEEILEEEAALGSARGEILDDVANGSKPQRNNQTGNPKEERPSNTDDNNDNPQQGGGGAD